MKCNVDASMTAKCLSKYVDVIALRLLLCFEGFMQFKLEQSRLVTSHFIACNQV